MAPGAAGPPPSWFPVDVTTISLLQFVQLLELSSVIGVEPLPSARRVPALQAASSCAALLQAKRPEPAALPTSSPPVLHTAGCAPFLFFISGKPWTRSKVCVATSEKRAGGERRAGPGPQKGRCNSLSSIRADFHLSASSGRGGGKLCICSQAYLFLQPDIYF